ncbi:MAG: type II toxin-antitoxin system VapB family antitoxin [Chloroflexi bacterium]|nr:type II toxin-antitoxin system VapB family antitoxin [Chloroflexota bacterium]
MRITLVIDDALLAADMKAAGVRTKRQAIEAGLRELVRQKNLQSLQEELGTYDLELSLEELERLRSER